MNKGQEKQPDLEVQDLPELTGYMTVSLAAEKLELSRQTIHEMTRDGRLRAWRVPSATQDPVMVDAGQVAQLAATRRNQVVDVTP